MQNTNKRTYRDFWPWLESLATRMWSEGMMRHWATRGEPHSLNSALGRLPGGGVRNQRSGCEGGILYPFPTSQLHNPLGFLPRTASACWNRLFWRLVVVGRTSGLLKAAGLCFWGVTRHSAPSAASPQHPTHPLNHSLPSARSSHWKSLWLLPPGKLVFLIFCSVSLLCNCQGATISISSAGASLCYSEAYLGLFLCVLCLLSPS